MKLNEVPNPIRNGIIKYQELLPKYEKFGNQSTVKYHFNSIFAGYPALARRLFPENKRPNENAQSMIERIGRDSYRLQDLGPQNPF